MLERRFAVVKQKGAMEFPQRVKICALALSDKLGILHIPTQNIPNFFSLQGLLLENKLAWPGSLWPLGCVPSMPET